MEETFLPASEIESKIESGDIETINNLLSGNLHVGEPQQETEEVPEAVEQVETQTEETKEEAPKEEDYETHREYVDSQAKYNAELEAKKRELEEAEIKRQQAEAARQKLEELSNYKVENPSVRVDLDTPEDDSLEVELADGYTRNTRTMVDQIKEAIGNAASVDKVTELEQKLDAILQLEKQRQEIDAKEAAKRAEKERLGKLFSEVDSFKEKHNFFDYGRPTSEVYKDILNFKKNLSNYIGTKDPDIIERSFRDVAYGKDSSLLDGINKAGIRIPDGLEKYMQVVEIVDLKNGYKYNDVSGKYEPVTDEFGNVITQRSVEDAYKLSRFNDIIKEAKAEQVSHIEERLSKRSNSATTIPDEKLSDVGTVGMSLEEKEKILNLPNSAFKNNPELKQKLDMILNG